MLILRVISLLFPLKCLTLKCLTFVGQIQERDEAALKFLKDIKWFRIDNPKGFKLEFYFDANPFFKNTVLTKTYHMIDEDEPILEKAIGLVPLSKHTHLFHTIFMNELISCNW